jgi:hypothetical protein
MGSVLKTVLFSSIALFLIGIAGSVGFFAPSDVTPATLWLVLSTTLMVWFTAFVVGITLSSSAGWFIAGIGCLIGGVALTAHGRAEDSVIPLLGGGAIIVFTIVLIFLQNRLFLKQNRC